jgi:heme-degrading monooxygenase HmoA
MISRTWKGTTRPEEADRYVRHLEQETFPQLAAIPGFLGASILRRRAAAGVQFLILTEWESLDAIRRFAGDDPEVAVVPDAVRSMMVELDSRVEHWEVVTPSGAGPRARPFSSV